MNALSPRTLTRDTTPTKPSGPGHYPYRHQWHHLIPSAMLYEYLLTGPDGARNIALHLALMRRKYTINDGRNIALLPEEAQVGALVKFPTHLGNHPEYDQFAKSKLTGQKQRFQDELEAAGDKPHETVEAAQKAGALHKVSDRLFLFVEAFGRLSPGRELDAINQFAKALTAMVK